METELDDGTEFEGKGIIGLVKFQAFYFRVWIGKTVFILNSKDGFKKTKKDCNKIGIPQNEKMS